MCNSEAGRSWVATPAVTLVFAPFSETSKRGGVPCVLLKQVVTAGVFLFSKVLYPTLLSRSHQLF